MRIRFWLKGLGLMGILCAAGCATLQSVLLPPRVEVVDFKPVFITPQKIGFQAQLAVTNRLPFTLALTAMDFKMAVNDSPMFSGQLKALPALASQATKTVDVPLQIGFQDLLNLVRSVAARSTLNFGFSGQLHVADQWGFPAIPFNMSVDLPKPQLPKFRFGGVRLLSGGKKIGVTLNIENPNAFPLKLNTLDCRLGAGKDKYDLMTLGETVQISSQSTSAVQLQLGDTLAKTALLITRLATGQSMDFKLTGDMKADTAYGLLTVPISTSGSSR